MDVPEGKSIVLVDGVCHLCNEVVQLIVKRDRDARFVFASLQSEVGHALLEKHGLEVRDESPETVVLIENGVAYVRSTGALRIARRLSGFPRLLWPFIVLPRFLRDAVYRFIAVRRYRWFGRSDVCERPTPELRARFIDA